MLSVALKWLGYGYGIKVLGLSEKWMGGDVATGPGGGQKVNLLKKFMRKRRNDHNLVVLFVDRFVSLESEPMIISLTTSYDVILTSGSDQILKRFLAMNAKIVFSSEDFCWPDKSLAVSP